MITEDTLFTVDGWPNWPAIVNEGMTFNFIIGARGTGKTFSAIKYELEEQRKFMFWRKNQAQLDMVLSPEFNPFNPLNVELGYDIEVKRKDKLGFVYNANELIAYMAALSKISSIRGFDANAILDILYDEFIHEEHEKPLKAEGNALTNAYETINRNRELDGRDPVKLYCLANSNSLESDILLAFDLVDIARTMRKKGKIIYKNKHKSILLIDLWSSPIAKKKRETALYRATKGSEFYDMAIENKFSDAGQEKIKSMPLNEYVLQIKVKDICIYKHKSKTEYYVTKTQSGQPKEEIEPKGEGKKRLRRKYGRYFLAHVDNKVLFESMTVKLLFEQYFD